VEAYITSCFTRGQAAMRKLIVAATILLGLGLVLVLSTRSGDAGDTPDGRRATAAPAKATAGRVLQPESPEDLGTRGTADAGSTPPLAQAPSEEDGVLEVEVLSGERPVPGASVRLYWRGARDPNLDELSWRLASAGTTDEKGRVRLASRPGGYSVAVRAQGLAPLRRDVVRPYGEARTQLRLALEPGQPLTGRTVVQGTNEPLPLVELVLTAHGGESQPWQRVEAPAEERVYATSDERGNFRVDGLAPGHYQLKAQALGHAGTVLRSVKVPSAAPVTVALQVAGVIEGFVVDAQGRPASGAEVQVSGRTPQVVTTGEGGGFSVEVEPGTHTVSARRGDEAGSLDGPLTVAAGKTVRDVRVRLGQGSALEGRVVARATGAPVPGASVDVSPHGDSGDSGRAVTDEAGRFSVKGLAPGSYDLAVSAPGFSFLLRSGLTVASGERFPLELQLQGTGAVEGQVKDGAGQPVASAQVVGGNRWGGGLGSTPAEARTDAQGRYRLEGLATGRLYLTARREGSTLGVSQPVEVTEGSSAQADFTLEETGTVDGVVRATTGSLPAEPLMVSAFSQGSGRFGPGDIGRTELDASGHFRMTLPPGTYRMSVMPVGRRTFGASTPRMVKVEAGKTVRAELSWVEDPRDTKSVRGIVLEPDGSPSPGAFLTLSAEGPRGMRMMSPVDEEGRFSVSLPSTPEASTTLLSVSARNGGRIGEVAGVKPGEQDVVVKLRPSTLVRGRVVRAHGSPVRGFTVSLQPQDRGMFLPGANSWEFPGERFELRDAPAEALRLVVRTTDGAGGEALVTPSPGAVAEVEVTVKATAGVRGRVVEATTKAPLADAMVFIEGERPSTPNDGTAMDGRFSLEGVTAGQRTLVIFAGPGRTTERRPVTLTEGQVLDLGDIALEPPHPPPPSPP
jgi:protocatechuate 3,4-dioxygenase beta subunit